MDAKELYKKASEKPSLKITNEIDNTKMSIYNIHNKLINEKSLFISSSLDQAKKIFLKSANSSGVNDPTDFQLYRVGLWDKNTGLVTGTKEPVFIMDGVFQKQIGKELETLIEKIVLDRVEKLIAIDEQESGKNA